MCRAILNKSFHTFQSLGNMFIIQLPKYHNITSQLDNLSRWVLFPNKSILTFVPRIYDIPRQGLKPLLGSSSQGERKKLKFNYITIYFLCTFAYHKTQQNYSSARQHPLQHRRIDLS